MQTKKRATQAKIKKEERSSLEFNKKISLITNISLGGNPTKERESKIQFLFPQKGSPESGEENDFSKFTKPIRPKNKVIK